MSASLEPGRIRFRLKKRDKIRLKTQFDQVRQEGRKSAGPGIVAVVAPSPSGRVECGVICSKRYSLLSVKRNRARRLLWESFRMLKPELPVCRIILIPRKKMENYDQQKTMDELAKLLIGQGILKRSAVDLPQVQPSSGSGSIRN